jgi:Glycosyl hydrolase family 63 C-terminal domain
MNAEKNRLHENYSGSKHWLKWGPYLSNRQWGTVREDYSADGSAWNYSTHDMARSKAYRWGEEGIGGICDHHQCLCFSLALWNKKDPILKERFFGLTSSEGNHGEDVKEYYFYVDNTPSHSYMKMLYKYPQAEFPYSQLLEENRHRTKQEPEFELIDTGIFDNDQYFDVFIEYAKNDTDDILIAITISNRANHDAALNVIPTIWFRNIWSWGYANDRPVILSRKKNVFEMNHGELGPLFLYAEENPEFLFCDNESNKKRLYNVDGDPGFWKDGINEYILHRDINAVNPQMEGTKAAANYDLMIPAKNSKTIRLRLCNQEIDNPFDDFTAIFGKRISEANDFYNELQRSIPNDDAKLVQRQALAGMLWTKQFYYYDVQQWLNGDPDQPPPPASRLDGRNSNWIHLNSFDIISMPDKWEFPWFAAWDLAFQCIPLAMIDIEFAKRQLLLLTREWYMHPDGHLPAYEWSFSDVNPPVQAWAALRIYFMEKNESGVGDPVFLERIFLKLLLNFTWWVNREDTEGNNIFEGGFLGLDNIGVFDRSEKLPGGAYIEQTDGTSWMAMYCLNMMRIALELTKTNGAYEDLATKFFHHFLYIASAMNKMGEKGSGLWDDEDEFFYDVLKLSETESIKLKVRSMIGLIPLFAVEVLDDDIFNYAKDFSSRLKWFLDNRPDLASLVSRWQDKGAGEMHLLSLLRGHRMKSLLKRMLNPEEFLSDYGVRSLSKFYDQHPYEFHFNAHKSVVHYTPGESDCYVFGGNSNWRGPIWMPLNFLLIESLQCFHHYYGDDFKVECPTGSGNFMTLKQIADELSQRLAALFLRQNNGSRAIYNNYRKMQEDPLWNNYILFFECFHGDNGRGVGSSHQTGWTALIARLLQPDRS